MTGISTGHIAWYKRWQTWLGALSLAVAVVVAILVVASGTDMKGLQTYGYFGAFVVGVMESAVIIIPFPAAIIIFALGSVLDPVVVGIAVGSGELVGSLSLYVAGRGGVTLYDGGQKQKPFQWLVTWMKKRGSLTLFLVSAILSPFFYPAGIAAGALKFPIWKFVLIVWGGKIIKGTIIAGAGWLGLQWFVD